MAIWVGAGVAGGFPSNRSDFGADACSGAQQQLVTLPPAWS
jgi:hypothetical protein